MRSMVVGVLAVGCRLGSYTESKMAPHLLENTRNRLGNGRPHELDPGIRMRFLSWPSGLAVTADAGLRRKFAPETSEAAGRVPFREAT